MMAFHAPIWRDATGLVHGLYAFLTRHAIIPVDPLCRHAAWCPSAGPNPAQGNTYMASLDTQVSDPQATTDPQHEPQSHQRAGLLSLSLAAIGVLPRPYTPYARTAPSAFPNGFVADPPHSW